MENRKWSNKNIVARDDAPRNCASWNLNEDRDLGQSWRRGASIAQLAKLHQRTEGAIVSRLCNVFGVDHFGDVPKFSGGHWDPNGDTWTSQDGRVIPIDSMELDHLLNVVNDCNFRVALLRRSGEKSLGGLRNPNLNQKTRDAFLTVRPIDVFPMWDKIVRTSQQKFMAKFHVSLNDVRRLVYLAWERKSPVPSLYEDATRFYLRDRERSHPPSKLLGYMMTLGIEGDEDFRRMCWNLRIDQPVAWRAMSTGPHASPILKKVKTIPPNRLNSALEFETAVLSTNFHDDWTSFY